MFAQDGIANGEQYPNKNIRVLIPNPVVLYILKRYFPLLPQHPHKQAVSTQPRQPGAPV